MSDAPAPTRAEEGRETGQVAYDAWIEGEWLSHVPASNIPLTPWRSLSDEAKAIWEAIERKSAAQAEAEVARLTAALAEAERERDEARTASVLGWLKTYGKDTIADFTARTEAAEASASALRERVATLEAALRPFAKSGELFSPRHPDDYDQAIYTPAAGQEYSLCGDHLRAARITLEAPHADK